MSDVLVARGVQGAKVATKCRGCNRDVVWVKSKKGSHYLVNVTYPRGEPGYKVWPFHECPLPDIMEHLD